MLYDLLDLTEVAEEDALNDFHFHVIGDERHIFLTSKVHHTLFCIFLL